VKKTAHCEDEFAKAMAIRIQTPRADAQTAHWMIRGNATKWGVDPNRVWMLGFSAGAMTTMATTLANAPDARPDFIAPIYAFMLPVTPPPSPQPMFAALASDDPMFGKQGLGLIQSWQEAGGSIKLHFHDGGNHGFGSHKKGTTSDLWFDQYMAWMKSRGPLKPAAKEATFDRFQFKGGKWCLGAGSNHRHHDFQSCALPTELPRHVQGTVTLGF
jgi:acetyl esterase/lipase